MSALVPSGLNPFKSVSISMANGGMLAMASVGQATDHLERKRP